MRILAGLYPMLYHTNTEHLQSFHFIFCFTILNLINLSNLEKKLYLFNVRLNCKHIFLPKADSDEGLIFSDVI